MTTARADGKELFAVCLDRDWGNVLHDVKVFDVDQFGQLVRFAYLCH